MKNDIASLLDILETGTAGQRFETVMRLKYLAVSNAELLSVMLASDSGVIRENAAWLVSQIDNPPEGIIPRLTEMLKLETSSSLREKVIAALGSYESAELRTLLEEVRADDLFS